MTEKVLVLNSTGKVTKYILIFLCFYVILMLFQVGKNVLRALKEQDFDVYGTTRNPKSADGLKAKGYTPVVANYVDRESLREVLKTTQAKKVFFLTDYFLAAKGSQAKEIEQAKIIIDALKEATVEFAIYSSAADLEAFSDKVKHIKSKIAIEDYLKVSGLKFAIIRPVYFFENLDDPANYNPLKKGIL